MIDVLRQTSEQYANRIEAFDRQISDAKENIKAWEKEKTEVEAAKAYVDSKIAKPPTKPATVNG